MKKNPNLQIQLTFFDKESRNNDEEDERKRNITSQTKWEKHLITLPSLYFLIYIICHLPRHDNVGAFTSLTSTSFDSYSRVERRAVGLKKVGFSYSIIIIISKAHHNCFIINLSSRNTPLIFSGS